MRRLCETLFCASSRALRRSLALSDGVRLSMYEYRDDMLRTQSRGEVVSLLGGAKNRASYSDFARLSHSSERMRAWPSFVRDLIRPAAIVAAALRAPIAATTDFITWMHARADPPLSPHRPRDVSSHRGAAERPQARAAVNRAIHCKKPATRLMRAARLFRAVELARLS